MRRASACMLVYDVGIATEIVFVGPPTPDIEPAINRIVALFAATHGALRASERADLPDGPHEITWSMICFEPDRPVGLRIANLAADTVWRTMLGRFGDNSKIDTARMILGINQVSYLAIARAIHKQG